MATARSCAVCGAELNSDAPEGLCPKCLLRRGLQNPLSAASSALDRTAIATESPTPPTASLPREGQQFGGYRLIRLLGQGGMGAVFEAEHLESERRVALKVLNHSLDSPEARKRFLREGRTAASINHPNSVYVYGTEEIDGIPVISMELVPGGTLKDRVKLGGPLPAAEAVDVILQVIAGLEAAQTAGVLHRDIKPANCFASPDGAVKVGDFGLSISTLAHGESLLTMAGSVLGTPSFASPEQLRGTELDVRSDIYSVGATLYYLLTGKPPLEAKDLVNLITAVLERLPDSPKKLRQGVPSGLSKVVMRCLAKERSIRFASYDTLTEALMPFSSVAPTPATLGLRFAAGILDSLIAWSPNILLILWIGLGADENLASERTLPAAFIYMAATAFGLAYYGLLEGIWGTSIGKAIFGLRVVGPDKNVPGIPRALIRAFVFMLFFELPYLIPIFFVSAEESRMTFARGDLTLRECGVALLVALLFSTMRRKNGFAAIHELFSGTRVIAKRFDQSRSRAVVATEPEPLRTAGVQHWIGSFSVVSSPSRHSSQEIVPGYDEKLRRRIWIHLPASGTAPLSTARRDLSRSGRLRWLNGKRSMDECWDAYEAPAGMPLIKLLDKRQSWSSVRFWLSDLAEEIHAGLKDQTLPPGLELDRVWITTQGRAVLLDFPVPGWSVAGAEADSIDPAVSTEDNGHSAGRGAVSVPDVMLMQQFLHRVGLAALEGRLPLRDENNLQPSSRALSTAPNQPIDPVATLPLHARSFLRSVREQTFQRPDEVVASLTSMLDRIPVLSWQRRLAALAFWPALLIVFSILDPISDSSDQRRWDRFWSENYPQLPSLRAGLETYGMLEVQYGLHLQKNNNLQQLFDAYLAGHFRELISNPAFWARREVVAELPAELRRIAERALSAHPSPRGLEIVDRFVAPIVDRVERFERHWNLLHALYIFWRVLLWLAVVDFIVAILFRTSIFLNPFGIVAVDRKGIKASRFRMFSRSLIIVAPFLTVFLSVQKLRISYNNVILVAFGGPPDTPSWILIMVGTIALVLIVVAAVWSIIKPERGLQDLIVGTWLVPK